MHAPALLVTLAVGLCAALVLGYATRRIGLSPIVGYVLAGIVVGPHTPGFIADLDLARQLAEIGVVLLMFGVGLHFHWRDLLEVRGIAVPGAVGQSLVATGLGALLAAAAGWTLGAGIVLGIGISVASTVVLMRGLEETGRLETHAGRVAVGWLVVEDVLTVLALVLLPALAGTGEPGAALSALGAAIGKLLLLVGLVLLGGARVIPRLMAAIARTRSRELFTLTVLVVALVIATGSAVVFGVSMALGAFLAGMVVGQSSVSSQAAADALPLRDAFAVLFFVSVGMLFDPAYVLHHPWFVLGVLALILVAKPIAAMAIVALLGYPVRTALTVAVGLAQIGEFSFILGQLGHHLGVFPDEGRSAFVAGALLSISVNPLLFRALDPMEAWLRRRPRLWRLLGARAERRGAEITRATSESVAAADPGAVVVGHGPVGATVTRLLREFGVQPVVVELNLDTVVRVQASGGLAVYGDAANEEVLRAAGIARARWLIVTLPDLPSRIPVILTARELNPDVRVLVRARYLAERAFLEEIGTTSASYEEAEAAVALADLLLRDVGATPDRIADEARKIRAELAMRPAD